jgi:hypothetical protein
MRRKGACVELADDQLMLSVDDAAIESVEARDGGVPRLHAHVGAMIWQVPATTIAVWKEVYKFLSKYNLILQERRDLIEDVDRLRVCLTP